MIILRISPILMIGVSRLDATGILERWRSVLADALRDRARHESLLVLRAQCLVGHAARLSPRRSSPDDVRAWLARRIPTGMASTWPATRTQHGPKSGAIKAPIRPTTPYPDRCPTHRSGRTPETRRVLAHLSTCPSATKLAYKEDVRWRLPDRMSVTRRPLLALIPIAISRHRNVWVLLLVVLAACLRHGHQEDRAALPQRRNLTLLGRCPNTSN